MIARIRQSLLLKLLLPLVVTGLLGLLFLATWIPVVIEEAAIRSAVVSARSTADQYKELRRYYTEQVVARVSRHSEMTVDHRHRSIEASIPLPATLIHDLSEQLGHRGIAEIRLYSGYPFPNRADRQLDDFGRRAWRQLSRDPQGVLTETVIDNGPTHVRVAIPDTMAVATCVNCHNYHPESPKTDWQLNDVRGILEVSVPVTEQLLAGRKLSGTLVGVMSLLLVLLVIGVLIYYLRFSQRLQVLNRTSAAVARGDLESRAEIAGSDELSQFAGSYNEMLDKLASTRLSLLESQFQLQAANDELKDFNRTLEQQVEERTHSIREMLASLTRARDDLMEAEKMASLGNLVAGLTHEVNTPIGICVTAVSSLEQQTRELLDRLQRQALRRQDLDEYLAFSGEGLAIISQNIARAAELIRSFKLVAVDQSDEVSRSFNLRDYLQEILRALTPKLKSSAVEVRLDCPDDLLIDSYPSAFYQIISNLVINAIRHGFAGRSDNCIRISVSQQGTKLTLICEDNGSGVDERLLPRLFEAFVTSKRDDGGSGIGLHIVHSLVTEKLGGEIHCDSRPGCTRFIMRLPLA